MGLRNLPSKTWVVSCGWVLAPTSPPAWRRLLGLYDCDDLKDAEPDTLRYRLWSLPARLVRHARARVLKISRTWPWKDAFLACCHRLYALPPHPPDQPPLFLRPGKEAPSAQSEPAAETAKTISG
jgi:hypothetical protein